MKLCKFKKAYQTFEQAQAIKRRIVGRTHGRHAKQKACSVYKCQECGFWHLAHAVNIYKQLKR